MSKIEDTYMQSTAQKAALPAITLAALGVVFGDIGTSPLYALRQCFLTAHLSHFRSIGARYSIADFLVHDAHHQF